VCIEAVGTEAHSDGPMHTYDQVKQQLRLRTDRPTAVRQAIHACRKGGTVRFPDRGLSAGEQPGRAGISAPRAAPMSSTITGSPLVAALTQGPLPGR
jgi:threonine dehydrogenase-like Zn-dependent dehydrogenase